MAARCPESFKSAPVIKLDSKTPTESRPKKTITDLVDNIPTDAEIELAHNMYESTLLGEDTFLKREVPQNSIWMHDTALTSVQSCVPETQVIHRRLTGGWLTEQAISLANSAACIITEGNHKMTAIDDILYRSPGEIGTIFFMKASVVYSEGNKFQVRLEIEKKLPNEMKSDGTVTAIMNFTFESDEPVPMIVPHTYGETM